MNPFKKFWRQSELFKNVAVLVSGTALAQACMLLASPILTRLFSPEDFAIFAQFMAIVSIISVVANARYELAIVLPKTKSKAKELLFLSVLFTFAAAIFTFIIILCYDFFFSSKLKTFFSNWFYLCPMAVLLSGLYTAFNYWSSRCKTFYLNSKGRVGVAVVNVLTSVGLGLLGYAFSGLIIGFIFGQLLGVILMANKLWINGFKEFREIKFSKLKERAIEYKNFPLVNAPHAFIDSVQDNGVIFILSYYFVSPVVAFYAHAFRLLKAPVGLIGSAFYQVAYQKMSQMRNDNENIRPFILGIYKKMFLIGFPFFLVLFLFTPQIFSFVFGEEWKISGEIAQILIPCIFLNFVASPISGITLVYGKQKQAFYLTLVDISVRFLALIAGGILQDYHFSFVIISSFCSALLIFTLVWYYRIPSENEN